MDEVPIGTYIRPSKKTVEWYKTYLAGGDVAEVMVNQIEELLKPLAA